MSLINQMLRDLDARQASGPDRAGLPPRLRPLPPARLTRQQSMRMLLIGMALGGVVAGGVVAAILLTFRSMPSPVLPPPTALATVPAAASVGTPVPSPPQPLPAPVSQPAISPAPEPQSASPALEAAPATVPQPVQSPAPAAASLAAAPVPAAAPSVAPPAVAQQFPAGKAIPAPPAKPAAEPVRPTPPTAERKPVVTERTSNKPPAPPAAVQIEKPARTDPGRDLAEAEYQKGMQAVNAGNQAAALPFFRNALSLNPRLAHARQALLSVLVSGRMWDEAREAAQAGLSADPTRTGWAVILTRLQHERGDTDAALKTLETHLNYANDDADYLSLYAFLLHRGQRYPEAVRQYRSALALRPKEGRWWYGLGMALAATGREEEAKVAYVKAREVGNLPADMQAVIEERLK